MTFKQLLDLNEIERDAKGIYHSISNTQTTDQLDLVVVPGVGFKSDGYRIGYGGGFMIVLFQILIRKQLVYYMIFN